ncbi:dihydroorotase [Daejeonella oryzae]|uniref:dihydroorotase n=1 Tax=Daejeonella oryzae TaxID=1122943 RepID=UPI0004266AC0|nr:dihydroorotase [Daejeonella oryzae]
MKRILLQHVTILDKQSPHHGKQVDVLIENGSISEISKKLIAKDNDATLIDGKGQYLSAGFFDLNVNFGEPGLETKEDIQSGCAAAAAGGITGLTLMPNTEPPIHSKAEISYIVNKTRNSLVDVLPVGTISANREGKNLAELYDMQQNGAIAFSDGNRPVCDAGLMSRALLYVKGFGGLIFSNAEDPGLSAKGKMNEGVMSTLLGMKGNPALAEELMVARDLYLAEYNEARIHFSAISTERSVELIRQARKNGVKVTCDVAAHHLLFSDEDLEGFDSNYKVKPPLRTKVNIKALLKGLRDGTIDAIVSQHTPHEIEFKNVEFEIAEDGITGLQTLLSTVLKAGLSVEEIVEKLAVNPRKILNLAIPTIKEGEKANLVLFDPEAEWEFNNLTNQSKSKNSPLFGQSLKGKVNMVFNNDEYILF